MSALQSAWGAAVRGGFRLLYREMSWSYDAVSHIVSMGQWGDWRRACLPFLQGTRVLELGCGPGHLQLEMSTLGMNPVGLDVSTQMTRTAATRMARAGYRPQIVRGVGQSLPFRDGRFDSVVATFPTLYIAQGETLHEVRRVLRPGGCLVAVLEAQLAGKGPLHRAIDFAYRLTGQRSQAAGDGLPGWSEVLCEHVSSIGFDCAVHPIVLSGSTVTLIVARRLGSS